MKNFYFVGIVILSACILGCGQQQSQSQAPASSEESAKKEAQSMMGAMTESAQQVKATAEQTAQEVKADVQAQIRSYIGKANEFLQSQKFEDAIKTAQYILSNLDANNASAKNIIEQAKAALAKMAQQKVGEIKAEAGKSINSLTDKLGGVGK